VAAEDLRTLIRQKGWSVINLEPKVYDVALDAKNVGLNLTVAGTTLDLTAGAVIRLKPNAQPVHSLLQISAPDCVVRGGVFIGDTDGHDGAKGGEWGFGIRVAEKGHRALVDSVVCHSFWGDGLYVGGNAQDVRITNCTSFRNRRNGMSIVHSRGTVVEGGFFGYTHKTLGVSPLAGICLETHTNQEIVGAQLANVTMAGCPGHGLLVIGTAGPVGLDVRELSASGSDIGVTIGGPLVTATVESSRSFRNARHGFQSIVGSTANFVSCASSHNGVSGFYLASPACVVRNCTSNNDGVDPTSAFLVDPSAQGQAQVIDSHGTGH